MSCTRYFKIAKGTQTYKNLEDMFQKIEEGNAAAKNLALELGSPDGTTLYLNSYATGGTIGVKMNEQPPGWKKVYRYTGFYFPKQIKANHDIIKRIRELPHISRLSLSNVVGYNSQFGAPGIQQSGDHFTVEMTVGSTKESFYGECTPTSDMVEITGFEYLTLSKEEDEI